MNFQLFLKSKFATWLLGIDLLLIMIITAKVLISNYQVNQQIAKLQAQAAKIKKDNDQLSYLIKYYNTPAYQEQQAREKLNLKKDGESVVALPQTDTSDVSQQVQTQKQSNFKQWFDYFFSTEIARESGTAK